MRCLRACVVFVASNTCQCFRGKLTLHRLFLCKICKFRYIVWIRLIISLIWGKMTVSHHDSLNYVSLHLRTYTHMENLVVTMVTDFKNSHIPMTPYLVISQEFQCYDNDLICIHVYRMHMADTDTDKYIKNHILTATSPPDVSQLHRSSNAAAAHCLVNTIHFN